MANMVSKKLVVFSNYKTRSITSINSWCKPVLLRPPIGICHIKLLHQNTRLDYIGFFFFFNDCAGVGGGCAATPTHLGLLADHPRSVGGGQWPPGLP
jgi:hypothetical protein